MPVQPTARESSGEMRERLGTPRSSASRAAWYAGLAAVLALAAWARVARFAEVIGTGEVVPLDGDCAYHLRRILLGLEDLRALTAADPGMDWPRGGRSPWMPGFDVLGVWLARALGGAGHPDVAALAAALLPVVLGVVLVWATVDLALLLLAGRPGGRCAALGAGVLASLLPQAVASSRFGRVDHHVLEALSMVLLACWALRLVGDGATHARWRRAGLEAAGAAAVAVATLGFTGGVLYVSLATAVVGAAALAAPSRSPLVGSGAPALLGGAALAAIGTWPVLAGPHLAFGAPSWLQPLLVAAAGMAVALAWAVATKAPATSLPARAGIAIVLGVALATGCALLFRGAIAEVGRALSGWLLRRDPWLARVIEFQPLLGAAAPADPLRYFFGWPGVAAPLLLPVAALVAWHRARWRGVAFAALLGALAGLTLVQNRFGRVFAPFLAVAAAVALSGLAEALARRARAWERVASGVPLLAIALVAIADTRLRGALVAAPRRQADALVAAALDLRSARLPERGAEGVLARWDYGHDILLLSGRPVVANGFGSYLDAASFDEVERVWRGDQLALERILESHRLGFVVSGAAALQGIVLGPDGEGPFRAGPRGGALDRRWVTGVPLAPLLVGGSGFPDLGVPHLAHLLPRFASAQLVPDLSFPLPALWTYEHVAGARLQGRAAPGARVEAQIALRVRGRWATYRAWGEGDGNGGWEIILPVPTSMARPTVQSAARWSVRVGDGQPVEVEVPETAVLEGLVVRLAP